MKLPLLATLSFAAFLSLAGGEVPKGLDAVAQEKVLARRLNGSAGGTFSQFANMFLVGSHRDLGFGLALMTSAKEIAETQLSAPWPEFYLPTVREFLDQIALQTGSAWSYDGSGKFIRNGTKKPVDAQNPVVFEFKPVQRAKPYTLTLAPGWQARDRGHWMQYIPPGFPAGMDIHEVGHFSADDHDPALLAKVPREVSLMWTKRMHFDARAEDLHPANVGALEALFFETTVTNPEAKMKLHWRQWVFMDGPNAYFIVSTLPDDLDATLYPAVEAMLHSFKVRPPATP